MRDTTLCYIRRGGCYLMLHRVKKENDLNHDRWIGVGGKFEPGEDAEACLLREVREETGLTLTQYALRGIVTFRSAVWEDERMHLFTADGFEGVVGDCDEGTLEWVPVEKIPALNLWEGDRLFLPLLETETAPFAMTLVYDAEDRLTEATLNGRKLG